MQKLLFILFPLLCYSQSKSDQIETLKYYLSGENTFEKKTVEINYNKSIDAFYINLHSVIPPTNTKYVTNTSCRFKTSEIKEIDSYYKDKILMVDVLLSDNKCEHTSVTSNLTPEIKVNYLLNFSLLDISLDDKNSFIDALSKLFNKNVIPKDL